MSDQGRKIDWRLVKGKTKYRGRFYDCHPEQKEVIEDAINKARKESGTKHDTVALELICLNYLTCMAISEVQIDV